MHEDENCVSSLELISLPPLSSAWVLTFSRPRNGTITGRANLGDITCSRLRCIRVASWDRIEDGNGRGDGVGKSGGGNSRPEVRRVDEICSVRRVGGRAAR